MEFDQAMAVGAARYADALEELSRFGPSSFTQTGGMCAALEVTLERGILLVTDPEDSLPWSREDLLGWGVGYYTSSEVDGGPELFLDSDDTSIRSLVEVVKRCLREAGTAATQRGGS